MSDRKWLLYGLTYNVLVCVSENDVLFMHGSILIQMKKLI